MLARQNKIFLFYWTLTGFFLFGFFLVLFYPYFWISGFKEKQVRLFFYKISRLVLAMVRFGSRSFKVQIEGTLPKGAALITPNHSSVLDILCFGEFCLVDIVFISRGWPLKTPFMGTYLRRAGCVVFEEGTSFDTLISRAKAAFAKGLKVVVFPEGTRSVDSKVHRFRSGAFLLAQECHVPVVPAALKGLGRAIPKHCVIVRPADISLTLLPSVAPFEKGDTNALKMARYVKDLVVKKLEE